MEIKIAKPKLPDEKILQSIEARHGKVIARNGYVSRGYYNCNHMEGKNTPAYHANNGEGGHVTIVNLDDVNWVVLPFGGNVSAPILFIPVRQRDR